MFDWRSTAAKEERKVSQAVPSHMNGIDGTEAHLGTNENAWGKSQALFQFRINLGSYHTPGNLVMTFFFSIVASELQGFFLQKRHCRQANQDRIQQLTVSESTNHDELLERRHDLAPVIHDLFQRNICSWTIRGNVHIEWLRNDRYINVS